MAEAMLKITLVKSPIGQPPNHRLTVKALGLGKLHKSVVLAATPQVRGMVKKISYLLQVEEQASC